MPSPHKKIDVVVGLDARGFLLGPSVALRLGAAFVPVRKRGKLPGQCVSATYEKEYGEVSRRLLHYLCSVTVWLCKFPLLTPALPHISHLYASPLSIASCPCKCNAKQQQDIFECQSSSIPAGSSVLVIDDLIATGGSAKAAGALVAQCGAHTVEYLFVVSIPFLQGHAKLDAPSYR